VVLIISSFLCFIFPSKIFRTIISAISVIIFSIYLIYDTQIILGNSTLKLSIDDYIFAALNLYLDILNIFLNILYLLGGSNN
jgi:FtsH-binding integral membrane protein